MGDDAGIKALQELRDKYEGKLTASLYMGTLCVAAIASLVALGALCFTDYPVSTINNLLFYKKSKNIIYLLTFINHYLFFNVYQTVIIKLLLNYLNC